MTKLLRGGLLFILLILLTPTVSAQIYGKLNGLYALGGVINPSVEFRLSKHSTFQTELVYSPWESITIKDISGPMKFLIFTNEYRYFFREHNAGWYLGGNVGVTVFNMTKPLFSHGIRLKPNSSKGYGLMVGMSVGYEWIFKEKWILDVHAGLVYVNSQYNGYALIDGLVEGGIVYNKGDVILTPHRNPGGKKDPFNGSGEWLPNKIGVSFGILLFDPHKRKN